MKINVEFLGLPDLIQVIGGKRTSLDFDGSSVKELLSHIISHYGRRAREALLDQSGSLDVAIQVLLNGKEWVSHDQFDRSLQEGDTITLMLLVAGG